MASGYFLAQQPTGIDLTVYDSGDPSPLEDFITLFVKASFQSNSNLVIQLGSPTHYKDIAVYTATAQNKQQPASTLGLASILEIQQSQTDLLGRDRFASVTDQDKLSAATAEKTWIIPTNEWQFLTIPKRLFIVRNQFSFDNVNSVRLSFNNITMTTVCFSDIFLFGGGVDHSGAPSTAQGTTDTASSGLQGTYKYKLTYKNSTTGNRSNPSAATQVAENVNRAGVTLSNIPVSSDSQVDLVEVWRTVGGGSDFFKIAEVANGTTTFIDEVADHDSLDSRPGIAVMTDEAIQFDNDVPLAFFDQHVIIRLRAFWIGNGAGADEGRLFFSPTGRPESLDGFIDVSRAGDPLHRLAVLNGILYVFSESRVYRIDEDSEGFLYSKEIGGVPGVQFAQRRTVVPTSKGILWQATDGIRAFDGNTSVLVNPDPIQKVFRGETGEGISAFEGIVASFARGEYVISDGTQCIAVSLDDRAWRNLGFGDITSIFYEWDTDKIVAGRVSNTQLIEEEGVFVDVAAAIPVEWETPALGGPNDQVVIVERVFIDMDPNSNTVNSSLINRFDTVTLTAQSGSGRRTFETEVQLMTLKPSVRISSSCTTRITVYNVELEVRNLTLGVNLHDGNRIEVNGRMREDVSNGQIVFEIKPDQSAVAALNQAGRLFIIDRLSIEANTQSTDVIPSLLMHNDTITLATITNSARGFTEYEIDRIGQLEEVRLSGDFTVTGTRPQIYRAEIYLRELEVGVNVTSGGQRYGIMGRSPDPTTGATFELQPIRQELNELGSLFWVERVVVEAATDSNNLTLTYTDGLGNAIAIGTVNNTTREYTEFSIERPGPIRALNITTDLTDAIQIYGIEVFVRPVLLTVQDRTAGQVVNTKHDGKMVAQDTQLVFDVDPYRNELDGDTYVPLIELFILDIDTGGNGITPKIVTELGTLFLTSTSTTSRETVVYNVDHIGNVTSVILSGNFTSGVALYDARLMVKGLDMGFNIISDGG